MRKSTFSTLFTTEKFYSDLYSTDGLLSCVQDSILTNSESNSMQLEKNIAPSTKDMSQIRFRSNSSKKSSLEAVSQFSELLKKMRKFKKIKSKASRN